MRLGDTIRLQGLSAEAAGTQSTSPGPRSADEWIKNYLDKKNKRLNDLREHLHRLLDFNRGGYIKTGPSEKETAAVSAGGVGSGCRGPNCGRPRIKGFIGNLDSGPLKGLAQLPTDPDDRSQKMTAFWVAPNGDTYRESDMLGPGFHEHWEHAYALMKGDPKYFDWIKSVYDKAYKGGGTFGSKYGFVEGLLYKGAIRTYCALGSTSHWDAGIDVGELNEQTISRVQNLVASYPTDSFRVDWRDEHGIQGAEGSGKEVLREIRKAFYGRKGDVKAAYNVYKDTVNQSPEKVASGGPWAVVDPEGLLISTWDTKEEAENAAYALYHGIAPSSTGATAGARVVRLADWKAKIEAADIFQDTEYGDRTRAKFLKNPKPKAVKLADFLRTGDRRPSSVNPGGAAGAGGVAGPSGGGGGTS